jgi:hypothetical protein
MASKEQQSTDPSTPSALRSRAPTDPTPTPMPVAEHVRTDPGVGPVSPTDPPPGPRTPPMGLVVPAASRVKPNKNSVELLLEGMQGPQPERPKTTPQTDGQASASYHAEHGVRPARTSPDDEPKVVVERAPLVPTTRIDRAKMQQAIDHADALRRSIEPPPPIPQQMAPRVVAAIVAGMTVVVGLFLVLRFAMGSRESPRPAIASPPTQGATVVATAPSPLPPMEALSAASASPAPPSPAFAAPPATPPAAEPVMAAPREAATTPAASSGARPRNPRTAPAVNSSGTDLGEFKTTFH